MTRRAMAASCRASISPRPTSACWSTSTCRGSRARCATIRRPGGPISTSTPKSAASRCTASRPTCACRATATPCSPNFSRRAQAAKLASDKGKKGEINPHFLCATLNKALKPGDIVVSEAIRNTPAVLSQMPRTEPGSLVGMAGGGLGFSGGVALGLKLAMPERTILQMVGDGTFYFSNPQSSLSVSRHYGLPVFTVVFDNAGWGAVKESTLRVYPDGSAKAQDDFGATLSPDMDFAKVGEAAGAHGELVSDPDAVEGAIARCMAALKDGRSAVLHAKVTKL